MNWNKKRKRLLAFLLVLAMILPGSRLYTYADTESVDTEEEIYIVNPGAPYPIPEKTCSWVKGDPDVVQSGPCVMWIESFLMYRYDHLLIRDLIDKEYTMTGDYSEDTATVVKKYQHDAGLPETGITDAVTRETMLEEWRADKQSRVKEDHYKPSIDEFWLTEPEYKGIQAYVVVSDDFGVKRVTIDAWCEAEGEAGKKETVYEADIPGNTIKHMEPWGKHNDQWGLYTIRVTVEDYNHNVATAQNSWRRSEITTEEGGEWGSKTTEPPTTEKVTTTEPPTTEKVTTTESPTTEKVTTTESPTTEKVTTQSPAQTEITTTEKNAVEITTTEKSITKQETTTEKKQSNAAISTTKKKTKEKNLPSVKKNTTLKKPVIRVAKKRAPKNIRYLQIQLKQYQGEMVEVYLKKEKSSYQKLKLKNHSIKKLKKKVNLQYALKKQTVWLKVRTYRQKVKQKTYSPYSNQVRIRW